MAEYEKFRSQSQGMDLSECTICGRKFMPESLERHEPICAKTAEKRRKPFDSSKQRIEGTDIATVKVSAKAKAAVEKELLPRKKNWRHKHAEFINTLRAARGVKQALDNGLPLPPPPPPVVNPDYVECPTCNRHFNETAAERHIPFCAEKSRRLPTKKEATQDVLQRNNARTQYKPPKLKSATQQQEDSNRYPSAGSSGQHRGTRTTGSGKQLTPSRRDATPGRDGYGATDQVDARKQYKPNSTSSRQQSAIAAAATGSYSYNGTGSLPGSDSSESINSSTRSGGQRRPARETSKDASSSPSSDGRPPLGPLQRVQQVQSLQQNSSYSTSSTRRMNSAGSGDSLPVGSRYSMQPQQPRSLSKFCHECGSRYCKETAAFCCDCGTRRMEL